MIPQDEMTATAGRLAGALTAAAAIMPPEGSPRGPRARHGLYPARPTRATRNNPGPRHAR